MNAFHQTCVSFTSQNYGAGNYRRIRRVLWLALFFDAAVGVVLGNLAYYFGEQLLGVYIEDQQAITSGMIRLLYTCVPYFLLGTLDIFVGTLRGMGHLLMPMLVSLTGICGLRILWIYTVFQYDRTLQTLYLSYPVTWAVTAVVQLACTIYVLNKTTDAKLHRTSSC